MAAPKVFFDCEVQGAPLQTPSQRIRISKFVFSFVSWICENVEMKVKIASENIWMWSGLCVLEASGYFSYKSLILNH